MKYRLGLGLLEPLQWELLQLVMGNVVFLVPCQNELEDSPAPQQLVQPILLHGHCFVEHCSIEAGCHSLVYNV
eukprot:825827-Amphidinium_carterae.1